MIGSISGSQRWTQPIFVLLLSLLIHNSISFVPLIQQTTYTQRKTVGSSFRDNHRPTKLIPPVSGTATTNTALMGIKGFRGWFELQFPSAMVGFNKEGAHESFDHVLIDVNQLLHTALRKSRSEEHGLVLLIKELDACVEMATPTKSLVLAMDGAPAAAKLSTQRQRRHSVVVRSVTRIKQLERVAALGKRKIKKNLLMRRKVRASAALRTLSITPGTEFMAKAAQAILFWAWQRMSNPRSPLRQCQIFLSPSTVPGEGEVKLLEWIYTKRRKNSTIAMIGGDSDLVLEGLIIPPTSTHDIFVLLPDGPRKYLAVSLWETTRALQQDYFPHMDMSNMMKIRTDLVVLFILNGNDYLPKLRGSSGFSKLFSVYKQLQATWHEKSKSKQAYLVDPDSLTLNCDFCIDFFSHMARAVSMQNVTDGENEKHASRSRFPLSRLNNLVDLGLIPKPVEFTFVVGNSNDSDKNATFLESDLHDTNVESESEELVFGNDDDVDDDFLEDNEVLDGEDDDLEDAGENEGDQVFVRLSLGVPGTEDSYTYELWWPNKRRLRRAQHTLANIAICDLIGLDDPDDEIVDDEDDDVSVDTSYDWQLRVAAGSKVDSYLYGILWNLQTYQDGICADYAYNYGKRRSPTAQEIVDFLCNARAANQTLRPTTLSKNGFIPPMNAGLSCLAALPSSVRELIPAPYSLIPEDTAEEIYSKCVDPDDNKFDTVQFERLCKEQLLAQGVDESEMLPTLAQYTTDDSWTVMSVSRKPLVHPFDPPATFSEKLSKLRRNRSIRVSQYPKIAEPRHRDKWHNFDAPMQKTRSGSSTRLPRIVHSSPGQEFMKLSIDQVPHRCVYTNQAKNRDKRSVLKRSPAKRTKIVEKGGSSKQSVAKQERPTDTKDGVARTRDNVTAMACLKQLEDCGIIANLDWKMKYPSDSKNAAADPDAYEKISLQVVPTGGDFVSNTFEVTKDRAVDNTSKKQVQQQLASIALANLLDGKEESNWQARTFQEIKSLLETKQTISKDC